MEKHFNWPQDIEWCYARNSWWFVQSRPITSITENEYLGMLYLDDNVPTNKNFYFEKTYLCETVPKPSPLTFEILTKLYSNNGPVCKAYRKYGIEFSPQDFLKIVGNDLYCDRDLELKTLLPAYSYDSQRKIKIANIKPKALWLTLKNLLSLRHVNAKGLPKLQESVRQALQADFSTECTLGQAYEEFYLDYSLIFEINLQAESQLKHLQYALKSLFKKEAPPSLGLLLSGTCGSEDQLEFNHTGLLGNSLDFLDASPFLRAKMQSFENISYEYSFENLTEWKKKYLSELVENARRATCLREYGRWLTVLHINRLRDLLFKEASRLKLLENQHIFFLEREEILKGDNLIELAKFRYENWFSFNKLALPLLIKSNCQTAKSSSLQGISAGKASGKLILEADLLNNNYQKPCILYTPLLSPSLVQYFDSIEGIVSAQGGVLSHLAIVAREHHLPVVSNVILKEMSFQINDLITIDGDTGTVNKW